MSPPSVGGRLAAWVFLGAMLVALVSSNLWLGRAPLTVAVFRGGDAPQAYLVSLFFNGREPSVEETDLTASQKHELTRSILTLDDETLRRLSKAVGAEGRYAASSSGGSSSVDWPPFFGGGFAAVTRLDPIGWVCSLTVPERLVMALWAKTPPAAPWNAASPVVEVPTPAHAVAVRLPSMGTQATVPPMASPVPTVGVVSAPIGASSVEPLRVEIRNGCGITNAADAVARAAKDAGMQVVFVGNAEGPGRFRVSKTFIESNAGVPVALEELCKRLGIPVAAVKMDGIAKAGVDVTVTVGRDYPKLRERLRGRSQR